MHQNQTSVSIDVVKYSKFLFFYTSLDYCLELHAQTQQDILPPHLTILIAIVYMHTPRAHEYKYLEYEQANFLIVWFVILLTYWQSAESDKRNNILM